MEVSSDSEDDATQPLEEEGEDDNGTVFPPLMSSNPFN